MFIRRIQKFSLATLGVGLVLILILTFKPTYLLAFTIGVLASNLNFYINYSFMNKSAGKLKVFRAVNNFLIRMVIYAIVLTLMFKIFGQVEMLIAFCGCLSIRVSIVLQELFFKGGYK